MEEPVPGAPCRDGYRLQAARDFLDACEAIPVGPGIADDAAALKDRHGGLSLPDAITLVVAELIDADVVWTLDRRWRQVQSRIETP